MKKQQIRLKIRSYDPSLIERASRKIVKAIEPTGAMVSGPIPLPTERKISTVLRSPHVNKKSREQFQQCTHKRLIDIFPPLNSERTLDVLMKLVLPPGIDVEIKG